MYRNSFVKNTTIILVCGEVCGEILRSLIYLLHLTTEIIAHGGHSKYQPQLRGDIQIRYLHIWFDTCVVIIQSGVL